MNTQTLTKSNSASHTTQKSVGSRSHSGWWFQLVARSLKHLSYGTLEVRSSDGTSHLFGTPDDDGLSAVVEVCDPACFRTLVLGGGLGAADGYIQGQWTSPNLVDVMRLFARNMSLFGQLDTGLARLLVSVAKFSHWLSGNTVSQSAKNISAHYDLGNEFFELFLDPTMMYSSGLFSESGQSMESASEAKLERICRQLDLKPEDHVLEIGTGWGGFACYAARNFGCRVTTTTISQNQFDFATQRVANEGLSNQVAVLLEDYRKLTGQYDKIVSIEMLEAVGHDFLPTYFSKCSSLLRPGGQILVQSITMPDHRYDTYRSSVDFIQKYIFPGGHLPSVAAIQSAIAKSADLQLIDAIQFPESYAKTLRAWRERFEANLDQIRRLGFDEAFINTWMYYLCYCEGAFDEHVVSVGQFHWERPRYA